MQCGQQKLRTHSIIHQRVSSTMQKIASFSHKNNINKWIFFDHNNRTLIEYRLANGTHDDCDIDSTNTMTFKIILMMGVTFVGISAIVSFYIDRIDRKLLLSEFCVGTYAFGRQKQIKSNFFLLFFRHRRSHMVINRIGGLSIDCIHQAILRDGALLYAFSQRWPVCGYHQCHFGCTISHELSVNDFHLALRSICVWSIN